VNEIAEIEQQLAELRAKLAELEVADSDASSVGQQLRNEWRAASLAADLDDDPAAAELADELQRRMQNAELADERRRNAITELRSRISSKEAALQRAEATQEFTYYRRTPSGAVTFGGIRRALKIPASGWEKVSRDRIVYELRRAYPDAAGGMLRSMHNGSVVLLHDGLWECKAELATELVE